MGGIKMILWLSLLVGLVSVRMEESPTENMGHMNITTEIFRLETTTDMSETAYSNETKEETTSITDDTIDDNSKDEEMIENFKEEESEEEEYRDTCLYKDKRPGFTCDSGECIDRGRVCDKTGDCSDGSDETISCCSTTCITPVATAAYAAAPVAHAAYAAAPLAHAAYAAAPIAHAAYAAAPAIVA